MLRSFVGGLAALALVVGTTMAADKDAKAPKGKFVFGKLASDYDGKTLSVYVGKRPAKRGEQPTFDEKATSFDVTDATPALAGRPRGTDKADTAKKTVADIKDKLKKDAVVMIRLDDSGKVAGVGTGGGRRWPQPKKEQ